MKKTKDEIVTFKVDHSLLKAMEGIPNRSEFIRNSILSALENVCPVCSGTGILTPNQMSHWKNLADNHAVTLCDDCHESVLVCKNQSDLEIND